MPTWELGPFRTERIACGLAGKVPSSARVAHLSDVLWNAVE